MVIFLFLSMEFYPHFIPPDSTPYVVFFCMESLQPDTIYYVKIRLKSDSIKRKYYGFTYNPEMEKWCKQRTPWTYHPVMRTDITGKLEGWVSGMLGNDTDHVDSLKIVVRMVGTDENIESQFYPVYTDSCGYLTGFSYKDENFTQLNTSLFVLAYSGDEILGTSPMEDDRIGELKDYGWFRIGLPESRIDSIVVMDSTGNIVPSFTVNPAPWFIHINQETSTGSAGVYAREERKEKSISPIYFDLLGRRIVNKNQLSSGIFFKRYEGRVKKSIEVH